MSESENENNSDIEEAWGIGCSSVIPEKSKKRYEKTYNNFKKWFNGNYGRSINEKFLLAYFVQRNQKLTSPGSLWAEYSMLKATIFLYDSIDISKFSMLIAFLKRKNVGHRPKKASVFTKEEMTKFLIEAPDETFLIHKVAMILGVSGACRREELYNMRIQDIENRDSYIIVKIPNTKTYVSRSFTVTNKEDEEVHYLQIIQNYIKLRPAHTKLLNLFLNYRNGKCCNQVVGKGMIGKFPMKIAEYLKLQDVACYTGHSFRRTSATLLANKGVDVLGLKRHGGWKSSVVAESYVEDSIQNKLDFSEKILHNDKPSNNIVSGSAVSHSAFSVNTLNRNDTDNKSAFPITINNCNHCTFHVNINK